MKTPKARKKVRARKARKKSRHESYVLTKRRNDLKPSEIVWNHLKPLENTQKLP